MDKVLRAKNGENKIEFDISNLVYIKSMTPLKELLEGEEMQNPIEVQKHVVSDKPSLVFGEAVKGYKLP